MRCFQAEYGIEQIRKLLFVLGLIAIVFVQFCGAEPATVRLPSEVPALPALSPSGEAVLVIKGEEAFKYRILIPPEVYQFVRAGDLVLPAGSALAYQPHTPTSPSFANQASTTGQIPADYRLSTTLPFGVEIGGAIQKDDSKQLAKKILWNSAAALWNSQIIDASFDLYSLNTGKISRTLSGRIVRMYPGLVATENRPGQLFKEWLRFSAPKPVEKFSWLTYRFLGSDEDLVWVYSPVIQKTRQVTGSNRSDDLLGTFFTLEDLFTSSIKPEFMEASVEASQPLLVPFPSAIAAVAKGSDDEDKCHRTIDQSAAGEDRKGSDNIGVHSKWNFEGGTPGAGAAFLPRSVVYVPRNTWRVELVNQDPYSQYGRQVLYVDAATFLPFMNVVYDRTGQQQKIVISAYGEMLSGEYHAPYLAWSLAFSPDSARAAVFKVSQYTACRAFGAELSAESFDPRRLGGGS